LAQTIRADAYTNIAPDCPEIENPARRKSDLTGGRGYDTAAKQCHGPSQPPARGRRKLRFNSFGFRAAASARTDIVSPLRNHTPGVNPVSDRVCAAALNGALMPYDRPIYPVVVTHRIGLGLLTTH
jgi:hypothetical protein